MWYFWLGNRWRRCVDNLNNWSFRCRSNDVYHWSRSVRFNRCCVDFFSCCFLGRCFLGRSLLCWLFRYALCGVICRRCGSLLCRSFLGCCFFSGLFFFRLGVANEAIAFCSTANTIGLCIFHGR